MKAVKKRVADRNIRDLLWKFLRAGVMYQGKVQETISGTPQGGIVSPLLANIYGRLFGRRGIVVSQLP
jgi:retron-type reverse transcriptase